MSLRHVLISRLTRGSKRLTPEGVRHAEYSFSQYGEDIIACGYFPTKFRGFYLDVGALHPFRFSNTALFHLRGWRGINIDPLPQAITAFQRHRPNDTNLRMAISDRPGEAVFQVFREPAFNRLKATSLDLVTTAGIESPKEEIVVPTDTLASVLQKHLPAGTVINFMTVDCEGVDLEVLQSNDWSRFQPQIVCVEDWQPEAKSQILRFLGEQGYEHIGQTHQTRLLKHRSFMPKSS